MEWVFFLVVVVDMPVHCTQNIKKISTFLKHGTANAKKQWKSKNQAQNSNRVDILCESYNAV